MGAATVFYPTLAAGYNEAHKVVSPTDIGKHPLRNRRPLTNTAQLLQLHGSLGWLRDPASPSDVRRFALEDLRGMNF